MIFQNKNNKAIFIAIQLITMSPPCSAAYEVVNRTGTIYAWADYLLWKPQEDGLNYTTISTPVSMAITTEAPNFDWDSGVRLGFGAYLGKGWDVRGAWSHLKTGATTSTQNNASAILVVTPLTSLEEPQLTTCARAMSTSNFAYDMVDIELGRSWYTEPRIAISPAFGITWARINQSQDSIYAEINASPATAAKVCRRNNFSGVGPGITVQTTLPLCYGLNLLCDVGGALLSGKLCSSVASGRNTGGALAFQPTIAATEHRIRAMGRLLVGAAWNTTLYKDYCDLYIRAGYEMQWWPRQWGTAASMLQLQGGIQQNGDLSLQGLVVTLGVCF